MTAIERGRQLFYQLSQEIEAETKADVVKLKGKLDAAINEVREKSQLIATGMNFEYDFNDHRFISLMGQWSKPDLQAFYKKEPTILTDLFTYRCRQFLEDQRCHPQSDRESMLAFLQNKIKTDVSQNGRVYKFLNKLEKGAVLDISAKKIKKMEKENKEHLASLERQYAQLEEGEKNLKKRGRGIFLPSTDPVFQATKDQINAIPVTSPRVVAKKEKLLKVLEDAGKAPLASHSLTADDLSNLPTGKIELQTFIESLKRVEELVQRYDQFMNSVDDKRRAIVNEIRRLDPSHKIVQNYVPPAPQPVVVPPQLSPTTPVIPPSPPTPSPSPVLPLSSLQPPAPIITPSPQPIPDPVPVPAPQSPVINPAPVPTPQPAPSLYTIPTQRSFCARVCKCLNKLWNDFVDLIKKLFRR